jgi:hypothetical protein
VNENIGARKSRGGARDRTNQFHVNTVEDVVSSITATSSDTVARARLCHGCEPFVKKRANLVYMWLAYRMSP